MKQRACKVFIFFEKPNQDAMKMSGHSDFKSMKPCMRITCGDIRMVADRWNI
jgi:hypothetical protein